METIEQYINALFAKMPASLAILHLRDEVLEEACASYDKLRADGMDQNTAVGSVLTSLGTLEDILARRGLTCPAPESAPASAPRYEPEAEALPDEVEDYLDAQYNISRMNALGVGLCICSPCFPMFFDGYPRLLGHWIGDGLGVVGFFGAIALAVMLFIYAGSMHKSWNGYASSVTLTAGMRLELRRRCADYAAQRTVHIAMGVGLCIFSPAMAVFFNSNLGAALMFGLVAIGVYLMILSGVRLKSCRKLLKNA